ncbi:aldo/keto reductase [Acuticoccus sp. M5D2P5]|uniref:aldo/keto reductase n=1 Tax=Acuticoccus kalidii TaxID=2910977 RepID=UPI001F1B79DD|nr:aldo/keto reductase [Acuticoccus kalidii]
MAATFNVAGVSIPKLGIGTFELHDEVCIKAVSSGLQAGYRHVDTAERYENEYAVGEGVRASGLPRDEVFITSKVWHDHLAERDMMAAAEASLERLGISQFDLYLIHWPSRDVSAADAVRSLCKVQERGLTRLIGISNFPVALIEEAVAASTVPLAVNQVEYHPFLDQDKVLEAVRKHGMGLTAYCPLARGKVLDDPVITGIAEKLGSTPAAVTVAWLLGQDNVLAIPRSRSPERLVDNLNGERLTLSAEDRAAIDALRSPSGRLISPDFGPDWD